LTKRRRCSGKSRVPQVPSGTLGGSGVGTIPENGKKLVISIMLCGEDLE